MPEAARCFRDRYGGCSAIWIAFTPKPQSRPQTKDGEVLKKACGKALVGETDYQVIRVDIELIDDLSVGLGLLVRIHKGTKLAFVLQKVNNEIWLPAEFTERGHPHDFWCQAAFEVRFRNRPRQRPAKGSPAFQGREYWRQSMSVAAATDDIRRRCCDASVTGPALLCRDRDLKIEACMI